MPQFGVSIESPVMIIDASFTLIYDVYSTSVSYDDHQFRIVICLYYRSLWFARKHEGSPLPTAINYDRKILIITFALGFKVVS